jgi:hypothetical protein
MGPANINMKKKNMLSNGKEIGTYGNRHPDWTPLRTWINVGSRSRPPVGLYGKKKKFAVYNNITKE